ncbi:MAG: ABC transporter substrate-binding protein, partial [Opitutales bacterium]|nr:ABC transporter substrate-binding protein [Opitutales bacterium]
AAAMLCACAGSAERKIAAEAELLAPLEAGVVLPKEPAGLSSEIKNAMLMAAEDFNAREEPLKMRLFFADTDGSKEQLETAIAVLKARRAKIIHAGYTRQCAFELESFDKLGALVNFFSQYPPAAVRSKNGVRIFLNGAQVCEEMSKEIPEASPLEKKSEIIVCADSALGKSCAEYLKYQTGSLNLKIYSESFSGGEKNFGALARAAAKTDYALVYAPEEQTREILNSLSKAGYKGKVYASCALLKSPEIPQNLDAKIVKSAFEANAENPAAEKFRRGYEKKYGKPPSLAAALAYDAATITAEAMSRSAKDPAAAKKSLCGKTLEGASGKITFDSSGDSEIPLCLSR